MVWTHDSRGHLAKSLETLYNQVDSTWPDRDKSSDGTIGNEEHAARASDHNIDEHGLVRALDISYDPRKFDAHALAEFLRTHPDRRVQYIISNGRIANADPKGGQPPWAWRPYTGSNPHNHHIHISDKNDVALAEDASPWSLPNVIQIGGQSTNTSPAGTLPRIHKGSSGVAVEQVQRKLGLPIGDQFGDLAGDFGSETEAAVVQFQEKNGLSVDGWVGPSTYSKLGIFVEILASPTTPEHIEKQIIATFFGGTKDPNNSAYDNHFINDMEFGVSLPFRFIGPRPLVWVKGPNGTTANSVPIIDVGPIYPHASRGPADPYWETGQRPRAETQGVLSKAGIDLTPALARHLGISEAAGKGLVDWGFMTAQPAGVKTVSENTPSENEPKGTQVPPVVPPVVVVTPSPTTVPATPLPPVDWGGIGAIVLPWLQSKLEGKAAVIPSDDISKLITQGLPLVVQLFGRTNSANFLPGVLQLLGQFTSIKTEPAMSGLDKLLGGEALLGKKTATGVIGTLLSIGFQLGGVMDPVTMGGTTSIFATLVPAGLAILGALAKFDRK